MVFITRLEKDKSINEGLCLVCAQEVGIKPVNDMLARMGIDENEISNMIESMDSNLPEFAGDETDTPEGKIPTLNLGELFNFGPQGGKGQNPKKQGKANEPAADRKNLSTFCHNLNAKAKEGKIDDLIGRDREIDRIIQILSRRQKNNPCLIGEPGVGKTAIAEELAKRIVEGRVPTPLLGMEIWLLDLTSLVAGTQFRGQFESRILGLLKEIKAAGNIILMIDEVHNIAGAGETSDGSMSAANLLKPALSRGEIRVIGATTLKEYRKHIEKDSALERRFQPVKVDEPSVDETVEIIKGIKKYYEGFHGLNISDDVARAAAILSEKYITDRFLPDKAIDLLDEAASKLSLSSSELNESLEIHDKLLALKSDREALESNITSDDKEMQKKYEEITKIQSKELQLSKRLDEITPECDKIELTEEHIAEVIELWTGIPATNITENEYVRIDSLAERLKKRLIGQDKAVDAVARAIKRNRAGISYKRKPVSFIFAGPTGVGKTELVKTLAADLFDSPETLIRLDMSEFMEKHSVSRIIGSPPGYVGYDDAGQLTEKIRRRPYSVVLFDEIEKAHPDVLNILLQILDDGRITDAHGKTVNFENTVIVMTTNAGSEKRSGIVGFSSSVEQADAEKTEKALESFLRPEFINRVDEVITFRSLDKEDFAKIAVIMLDQLCEVLSEKGINLEYSDDVARVVAVGSFSEKYGARNMRRYIQKNIEDKLAEKLISDYTQSCQKVKLVVENDEILVCCS